MKPLNNTPLYFYQRNRFGFPSEITLQLTVAEKPKSTGERSEFKIPPNFKGDLFMHIRYAKLYNEEFGIFSTEYVLENEHKQRYPLPESRFKTVDILTNTIDLTGFLNEMRYRFPQEYRSGKQKINLNISLILAPNIKTCAIFEMPDMEYDFGNYYINKIKFYLFDLKNDITTLLGL